MSVIGINFGNSYASIAVISNEGSAECIANEDGERQIATAIAFHGEELYIGNQATPQLVKNASNTITGFRDLLGLKFSEIPTSTRVALIPSSPVIEHPTLPDTPCYSVQILVPAPAPIPQPIRGTPVSSRPSTQHPTPLATPRSEPIPQTRLLTPHDAAVIFLRGLAQSAADFLGAAPIRVVLTAPRLFSSTQLAALELAASEAGLQNVHLLAEDAAAAALLPAGADRTALLVDWGATHLAVRVLQVRGGLSLCIGEAQAAAPPLPEALLRHFAAEFSKKSGEKLQVCPPPTPAAQRAQSKLVLAIPSIVRALTANRPAQLSVESLLGGIDFSTPLRGTRAALLLQGTFTEFDVVVRNALENAAKYVGGSDANVASFAADTIFWVGGTSHWGVAGLVPLQIPGVQGARAEDTGSPEEVLARGCALHAKILEGTTAAEGTDTVVRGVVAQAAHLDVLALRHGIGLLIPNPNPTGEPNGHAPAMVDEMDGVFIPIFGADTPLPVRRTVRFGVTRGTTFGCYVWEADEALHVRERKPPSGDDENDEDMAQGDADDDDDDEDDDNPPPRKVVRHAYLGSLVVPLAPAAETKAKNKAKTKSKTETARITVRVDINLQGQVVVAAREGVEDATPQTDEGWVVLKVGA